MPKYLAIGLVILVLSLGAFFVFRKPKTTGPQPTPTPSVAEQLPANQQPKVSLAFSSDSHYVTVNITDLHADQLEYNLIYDATVKGNQIQTGVNAAAKLDGSSQYSRKQLLGSESSGKFTYHSHIQNAIMELTLRDSQNRSIFSSTYPFTVSPGKSIDLKASE